LIDIAFIMKINSLYRNIIIKSIVNLNRAKTFTRVLSLPIFSKHWTQEMSEFTFYYSITKSLDKDQMFNYDLQCNDLDIGLSILKASNY
jgi:hypothetical protein